MNIHYYFCFSDMDIHVVDMDSMENKTLSGHRAPILSISLDPRLCFLVTRTKTIVVKTKLIKLQYGF